MTQVVSHASKLAAIPAQYLHRPKRIVPAADLSLPAAQLKWYDIFPDGHDTPAEIRDEAQDFLRAEVAAGRLEFRNDLGFAMLHLDGSGYFLLVCVWRDANEMWQTLYGRDADGFHPYPQKAGALKPVQNVFELDATAHERRAWSRYLTSARDDAARQAYLDDRCTGQLV